MKISLLRTAPLLLAAMAGLRAAPLAATTAVHTRADAAAPTITFLKAGTEPVAAADAMAATPAGWMAIELPGPFEGYVENKDLSKSLDVKPGAAIRLLPKADAGVLATAEKGDKTQITGLRGKWTQISLEKKLIGYIHLGGTPGYLPPIATTPAAAPTMPPQRSETGQPVSPAPITPTAHGLASGGQAAPVVSVGDTNGMPRQIAGTFVSTKKVFRPTRPYDYALEDDAGKRYAYLDVSKLLQNEQIEKFINHKVVVFGVARATADGKDIVIVVETLQLR